jgi:ADP-ribose pyrophosphatase
MADDIDDPRAQRDHAGRDGHLVETRVSSQRVFDGKLLHVRRDEVRLPDGHTATREYIVHPGAVLVVPVLDDGRLVVERQFRYPLNRVMIEFPAGKLDPGESPLTTAKRELIEEAGYTARVWTPLGNVHSIVSYSTEAIEFFVAEGLEHVGARLDHGEFLDIVETSVDDMLGALDRGEITDAKTVAALLLYVRRFPTR